MYVVFTKVCELDLRVTDALSVTKRKVTLGVGEKLEIASGTESLVYKDKVDIVLAGAGDSFERCLLSVPNDVFRYEG